MNCPPGDNRPLLIMFGNSNMQWIGLSWLLLLESDTVVFVVPDLCPLPVLLGGLAVFCPYAQGGSCLPATLSEKHQAPVGQWSKLILFLFWCLA